MTKLTSKPKAAALLTASRFIVEVEPELIKEGMDGNTPRPEPVDAVASSEIAKEQSQPPRLKLNYRGAAPCLLLACLFSTGNAVAQGTAAAAGSAGAAGSTPAPESATTSSPATNTAATTDAAAATATTNTAAAAATADTTATPSTTATTDTSAVSNTVDAPARPAVESAFGASLAPPVAGPITVNRVLDEYAESARVTRMAGGAVGLVAAGTLFGVGFAAQGDDMTAAHWIWAASAIGAAGSLATFFIPTELEKLRTDTVGKSDDIIRKRWELLADSAETERKAGAIIGSLLGTGSIIAGSVVLADGAQGLTQDEETILGVAFISGGALMIGGSVVSWCLPSEIERGYALISEPKGRQFSFSAAPLPGGFAVGASGTF